MSTTQQGRTAFSRGPLHPPRRGRAWERTLVGGFFLLTAGVHVGIVAADPSTYDGFADHALLDVVRSGWQHVFMARPTLWGLLLATGEATLGGLLLIGGRAARTGWAGVLGFHAALLLFGLGFWPYALSAAAAVATLAVRDLRRERP
jgi:hypothetical protein